jgi:hypothetical protein
MTWTRKFILVFALVSITANPVRSDTVIVQGFGGLVGHSLQQFGHSLAARNSLALQRRTNIRNLKRALADCGNCARRSEIEAALKHWLAISQIISSAEGAALKSAGLGQYRDLDHLQRALAQGPSKEWYARQRRLARVRNAAKVANRYCGLVNSEILRTYKDRARAKQAYDKCRSEYDPPIMVISQAAAKAMCSDKSRHANKAGFTFWAVWSECLIQNDPVAVLRYKLRWNRYSGLRNVRAVVDTYCAAVARAAPGDIHTRRQKLASCRTQYDPPAMLQSKHQADQHCLGIAKKFGDDRFYRAFTKCVHRRDRIRQLTKTRNDLQKARFKKRKAIRLIEVTDIIKGIARLEYRKERRRFALRIDWKSADGRQFRGTLTWGASNKVVKVSGIDYNGELKFLSGRCEYRLKPQRGSTMALTGTWRCGYRSQPLSAEISKGS